MDNNLSEYLKEKIRDKNISMHEVYRRLDSKFSNKEEPLSYPAITMIFNGKRKKVQFETLQLLAKALNEPYLDLLMAAGYIDRSHIEDLHKAIKSSVSAIYDDKIGEVIADKTMLAIIEEMLKLKKDDRQDLLRALMTYVRGFVAERVPGE